MKGRIHGIAGITGFMVIAIFWTSTLVSELFGSHADIAMVKTNILWGMLVLIPALAIAGASGMLLGRTRQGVLAARKKKRMPFIAMNGILILVPSALFLASRANDGLFDGWFYGVQAIELFAGAINLWLMGLNIRDGFRMSGRFRRSQTRHPA